MKYFENLIMPAYIKSNEKQAGFFFYCYLLNIQVFSFFFFLALKIVYVSAL